MRKMVCTHSNGIVSAEKENSVFSDNMNGENNAVINKPGRERQMLDALIYIHHLKQLNSQMQKGTEVTNSRR